MPCILYIFIIIPIVKLIIYFFITLKSASHINGNLNGSKELEHYAS